MKKNEAFLVMIASKAKTLSSVNKFVYPFTSHWRNITG